MSNSNNFFQIVFEGSQPFRILKNVENPYNYGENCGYYETEAGLVDALAKLGFEIIDAPIAAYNLGIPPVTARNGSIAWRTQYAKKFTLGYSYEGYLGSIPKSLTAVSDYHNPGNGTYVGIGERLRDFSLKSFSPLDKNFFELEETPKKYFFRNVAIKEESAIPKNLGKYSVFTETERPKINPDYVSESGSEYWVTENGIVRASDHWGLVSSSYFEIDKGNTGLLVSAKNSCDIDFDYKTHFTSPDEVKFETLIVDGVERRFVGFCSSWAKELLTEYSKPLSDCPFNVREELISENGVLFIKHSYGKSYSADAKPYYTLVHDFKDPIRGIVLKKNN